VQRRLKLSAAWKYVDETVPILHSVGDRVDPTALQRLPANEWTSLQLVRPRMLRFNRHYWETNRWVAAFKDPKGNPYSLKLTDPEATLRLERGEQISKKSLLTVSMTKPWTHNANEQPARCYKVVAAVIEGE
jgi:hypothetical protein